MDWFLFLSLLWCAFFITRGRMTYIVVVIAVVYYIIILGDRASYYSSQGIKKLTEKMPPFMLKTMAKMADAFVIISVVYYIIIQLNEMRKHINHLILFENKDPRCLEIPDVGLSKRVYSLLINPERIFNLNKLIVIVLDNPEYLLEIEGLNEEDRNLIVRKAYDFINQSYALTALFYSNYEKLKVRPWWYRMLLKRKDPVFRFIPELGLSRRLAILLVSEGIYTIDELKRAIRHPISREALLEIEDLEYEDFLEIFTKLEWWYRMLRKRKDSIFRFITELCLSRRVTVLLVSEGIYTIDELKRTLRKTETCKALLEIEDFADENFLEIFTKLEWWYRMLRKRKDSVFGFITELDLSPKVKVLLLYEGIYTIDELKRTLRNPISREALLEIEDFADEDFLEIFKKVDWC